MPVTAVGESAGAWMACEDCARLIEANDRVGIVKRGALRFAGMLPGGALTERAVRSIYEAFFAARTGPRVPYPEN